MGDYLLNAIITLEKELQSQVREESSRASAWRERQLAELAREEQELHTALANARTEQIEAARRAAEARGAEELAAIRSWCTRLEGLSDENCIDLLKPLLRRLLPEAGDDYQNGKG